MLRQLWAGKPDMMVSPVLRSSVGSWNPAKVWASGDRHRCHYCKEFIKVGEWTKQNKDTGHVFHDDCAEDLGAYNGLP